jgi:hypothetical protein
MADTPTEYFSDPRKAALDHLWLEWVERRRVGSEAGLGWECRDGTDLPDPCYWPRCACADAQPCATRVANLNSTPGVDLPDGEQHG